MDEDFSSDIESSEPTKQKRERSVNFTQEETDLLVSLVEAKKHIIENKKSDATTWQEKEKAWKDVEKEFNFFSGFLYRNHRHLKLKYEALKRDTRKKSMVARSELYKSRGGPRRIPILTPTEQKVKGMILNSIEGNDIDSGFVLSDAPKEKTPFDKLTEEKLETAKIQNQIIREELEQKLLQKRILEKELQHKEVIYELERQHLLLKIELLKKNLAET